MNEDQRFGSSLADQLWLVVSHDVAVRCCPGLQSSEGLTGSGTSTLMDDPFTRLSSWSQLLENTSVLPHMGLSTELNEFSYSMVVDFFQWKWSKRGQSGSNIFYYLASENSVSSTVSCWSYK